VQIFQNSGQIAIESKTPETAQSDFELAIEIYYQIVALRPGTELERTVTNAVQILADCFPSNACMNEAIGICEKANKLKSIKTKLKYLRKAQEILESGLARQDIGYAKITSIYNQVVSYVRQAEAIIEKQGKNADPHIPTGSVVSTQSVPPPSEIKFSCPNCTQHILVPLSLAGTAAPCPTCGHELIIPQPTGENVTHII
jgi:ribosomal protein S27E